MTPISAIGTANSVRPCRHRCAAFTLLEVLVVLAVIAVITAVALPAIARSAPERRVLQQAERIKQVIDLMCENAEIDGRVLGFIAAKNRYVVRVPPTENTPANRRAVAGEADAKIPWEDIKGRPVYAQYELPDGMYLELRLGVNNDFIELSDEPADVPQLPCAGVSELPEFRLTVVLGSSGDAVSRSVVPQPPSVVKLANWASMIEANGVR
jgi:prepilin-type N-terminal cleavage/methylation domain-containing protein